MVFLKPE